MRAAACAVLLVTCADAALPAFTPVRDGARVVPGGVVVANRASGAPALGALAPKMVAGPSQDDYLSSLEARKARQSPLWRPPVGYVPGASEPARDDGVPSARPASGAVPAEDDATAAASGTPPRAATTAGHAAAHSQEPGPGSSSGAGAEQASRAAAPAGAGAQRPHDLPAERGARAAPRWEAPGGYVPDRLRAAQARRSRDSREAATAAEAPRTTTAGAARSSWAASARENEGAEPPPVPWHGPGAPQQQQQDRPTSFYAAPRWEPPEGYIPSRLRAAKKPERAESNEPSARRSAAPSATGPDHAPARVEVPPRGPPAGSAAAPRWEPPTGYVPGRRPKAKTPESPSHHELSTRSVVPLMEHGPVSSKEATPPRSLAGGAVAAPAREHAAPAGSAAPRWTPPEGYVPDRLKARKTAPYESGEPPMRASVPRASGLVPPKAKAPPVSAVMKENAPTGSAGPRWKPPTGYVPDRRKTRRAESVGATEQQPTMMAAPYVGQGEEERGRGEARGADGPSPAVNSVSAFTPLAADTLQELAEQANEAARMQHEAVARAAAARKEIETAEEAAKKLQTAAQAAQAAARKTLEEAAMVAKKIEEEAAVAAKQKLAEAIEAARKMEAEAAAKQAAAAAAAKQAEADAAAKKAEAEEAEEAATKTTLEKAAMAAKKIEEHATAAAKQKLAEAIEAARKVEAEAEAKVEAAAAAAKRAEADAAAKKAEAEERVAAAAAAAKQAEADAAAKKAEAEAEAKRVEAAAAAKQAAAEAAAKQAEAAAEARQAEAEAAAKQMKAEAEAATRQAKAQAEAVANATKNAQAAAANDAVLLSDMSRLSQLCKVHVAKLAQTAAKTANTSEGTAASSVYVDACEEYEAQLKALQANKEGSPVKSYVVAMRQTYETTLQNLTSSLDTAVSNSDAKLLALQEKLVLLEAQLAKLNSSSPARPAAAGAKGSVGAAEDAPMSAALLVQLKAAYTQREMLEGQIKERTRQVELLQTTLTQTKKEAADYAWRLKSVEESAATPAGGGNEAAKELKDKQQASEKRAGQLETDLAALRAQTKQLRDELSQSEKQCLQVHLFLRFDFTITAVFWFYCYCIAGARLARNV